jgi:RecA-family ATPase
MLSPHRHTFDDTAYAFLERILPEQGPYAAFITEKEPKRKYVVFASTIGALWEIIKAADAAGHTAYHACAAYKEARRDPRDTPRAQRRYGRTKHNVRCAKALWFEVDAGPGKPYPDWKAAARAVAEFCRATGLSRPLIVLSGFGIHVYWPLVETLDPETWGPYARGLKVLCVKHGLQADPARTADITSVLRTPGTHHRKSGTRLVECSPLVGPYDLAQFEILLSVSSDAGRAKPKRLTIEDELGVTLPPYLKNRSSEGVGAKLRQSLSEPSFGAAIAENCEQVRALRDTKGNLSEPLWYACLGVLAFAEDGDRHGHEWSSGDERYTEQETQERLDRARQLSGPTTCRRFHELNPEVCERCSHWEKIKSPIKLGREQGQHQRHEKRESTQETQQEQRDCANNQGKTDESSREHEDSRGTNSPPPGFTIVWGDELLSTTALPRRWLVEKWVPAAEVTMLGGDGGTGKTTLALQLCLSAISGSDWIGLKVRVGNVLYVSAEDPKDEIHYRLEQITKHAKIAKEELARFRLIDLAGKDSTIAIFEKNGLIKLTRLFDEIESTAREHNVACIFFDAVADFFGGNENERREVRAFIGVLRGLALRLNASVIIVAHPSVDGIKTGRGYSGSTHWNNAVRSRLYFTDVPSEVDGLPADPDLRVIELAKSNRARRGEKIHMVWMDGRFVLASAGSIKNSKNETEAEEVFLQLLAKATKQGMHVSLYPSNSYAPTKLAKLPGSKGIGKAALEGAMHRLLDKSKIRNEPYGPPSKRRHRLVIEGNASEPGGQ